MFRSRVLSSHAGPSGCVGARWKVLWGRPVSAAHSATSQPPDATPATSRGHSERFRGVLFSDFHSSSLMPGTAWGPAEPGALPFLLTPQASPLPGRTGLPWALSCTRVRIFLILHLSIAALKQQIKA